MRNFSRHTSYSKQSRVVGIACNPKRATNEELLVLALRMENRSLIAKPFMTSKYQEWLGAMLFEQ